MNKDLKIIKKNYGEGMMHLCRECFPTLLEKEGSLSSLLLANFNPNHNLYNDLLLNNKITEFKDYIYNFFKSEKETDNCDATPKELLNSVGYDLYECKSEEDIQSFIKYYAKGEELCTFNGGRLDNYYVFFAVKKDVDKIKRKNFKKPKRQDLYGTSVISIQFRKDESHTLSIKNRYNHKVLNADATFSNNLDNIVLGLTKSFEQEYGMNQKYKSNYKNNTFEMNSYVRANNGKFYKYNYEINNIYYCPDNIIIDNFEVKQLPKERFILFDYFILDLKEKRIKLYDDNIEDSFINIIKSNFKIRIETKKRNNINANINNGESIKNILIYDKDKKIVISLDKENRFIDYFDSITSELEDYFLSRNLFLKKIYMDKPLHIGNSTLALNDTLEEVIFPNAYGAGNSCFLSNRSIKKIYMPNLRVANYYFMRNNKVADDIVVGNDLSLGYDSSVKLKRHVRKRKILNIIRKEH